MRSRHASIAQLVQPDFDWQQLRQLAGEDANFEAELLAMFLEDAEASLVQIELAIAAQDTAQLEAIAHSLQGASANVGASALAQAARQLEQIARRGELTTAPNLLGQLRRDCQTIRTEFPVQFPAQFPA
ncbi:MAG: Hpt domain-containing protein [Phormidesmis sp.]